MSTTYYCSRAAKESDPSTWPNACTWEYTARGSNNYQEPDFERCPWCGEGHVTLYGKPHVSPGRLRLTRALTAQAWAHAISFLSEWSGECILPDTYDGWWLVERAAMLPAPADLAAEILHG